MSGAGALMLSRVLIVAIQVSGPGHLRAFAAYECDGKMAYAVIGAMNVIAASGIGCAAIVLEVNPSPSLIVLPRSSGFPCYFSPSGVF
jgi:hypothetical protein